jgi:hypothetical protein
LVRSRNWNFSTVYRYRSSEEAQRLIFAKTRKTQTRNCSHCFVLKRKKRALCFV